MYYKALDSTAIELDSLAETSVAAGDVLSLPIVATLLFSAATTGLSITVARLLLVAFLEERNAELARSIRRAASVRRASSRPVPVAAWRAHSRGGVDRSPRSRSRI